MARQGPMRPVFDLTVFFFVSFALMESRTAIIRWFLKPTDCIPNCKRNFPKFILLTRISRISHPMPSVSQNVFLRWSSSSQIYRLIQCLPIQSKNSTFLWCKHLWPLAVSIQALLIRHNHLDFCVLKLYYVMLCYVIADRWNYEQYENVCCIQQP